jgi:hypothetical protein
VKLPHLRELCQHRRADDRTPFPRGMVTLPNEFDYETASWGKPPNGPRADFERGVVPDVWDLESFQVRVPTYWVVEWRDRWYEWEATGDVEWGECGCWGPPGEPKGAPYRRGCTPPPGICVIQQIGRCEPDACVCLPPNRCSIMPTNRMKGPTTGKPRRVWGPPRREGG